MKHSKHSKIVEGRLKREAKVKRKKVKGKKSR